MLIAHSIAKSFDAVKEHSVALTMQTFYGLVAMPLFYISPEVSHQVFFAPQSKEQKRP